MNAKQMKEFMKALDAIVEEKKIDKKIVVDAMEQAMAAAYKKNEGIPNVEAKVDEVTGDIKLYSYKTVVEEPVNEETEISLEDAKLVMGSSVKVYVSKLEIGPKGPFIMLSRSHYGFVKRLLEIEIPELSDGTVMLYSVARDAGSRTKIAVYTDYANVEPLGAVIGEKGRRIASVLKELGGEKIDVVLYDKDPAKFIANALSPAKNVKVTIKDESKKEALAVVPDDNLSLAIGRKGQNVKLASRLTHYKIEVKSESAMLEDEVVYTTKDDSEEESA